VYCLETKPAPKDAIALCRSAPYVGDTTHPDQTIQMNRLVLYNYFRSSTSFRVRIALELKKLIYEYKPIHLLNNGGEQHSSEYKSLNPMGGVPTLVHVTQNGDRKIIAQSLAIIEYLDEVFRDNHPLYPQDPYQKALIRQFCEIINADTHSYGNLRTLQYLEKNFNVTEEQKNNWIHHWILIGLQACEDFLTLHNKNSSHLLFCFGEEITAADLVLIPQIVTAQRFKVPLHSLPTIMKIFNNCMEIDAFKKAHPFRQIDTPDELRLT